MNKLRTKQEFVPDLSLVAVSEGKIVGHILLYPLEIVSDDSATTTLILALFAVHPDVQRRGIGSRLVEAGLKKAKQLGFDSVIVIGHPAYYPRFGFRRASGWGLRLPFDAPDDAFLAIELKPKSLEAVRGVVQFPTGYLECP